MRRTTAQTLSRTTGSCGETQQPRRSPSSHVSSLMILWIIEISRKIIGSGDMIEAGSRVAPCNPTA